MKLQQFADLPIIDKLKRLQAVTVGLALVFTLLATSVTEIWEEHRQIINDIRSTGSMIGFNAAAALLFNDSRSATEILAALRSKPSIIAAQLYTVNGTPFASYVAERQIFEFPKRLDEAKSRLQENRIDFLTHIELTPVIENGDESGYLYIAIDLRPMWWNLLQNLGQISLVILAAFLLSVLYGQRLARLISTPLMRLSQLSEQVSREKNYALRGTGESGDEIGQLVKSFNQMLEQIQQRDSELESRRDRLEQEVEKRTADLRQAVVEAQAASIAKSQFLATMSHEIRTPMNGVLGMTELLLGTELSLSQREYAEMVFSSADALLNIINDILDFSKIEAGKMELEEIDFNLTDLTDQLITLFFDRAHHKNIELLCHIDPEISENLRGDPYRLRQILINLLSNAIKFTEKGSVELHVGEDLAASEQSDDAVCLEFRVSDTGIGISADNLLKLFKPFSQADGSTTRKYGGTGLGLVICKELSELMGGTIEVGSQLGQGTLFCLRLPFRKALAPVVTTTLQNADLHGIRVLIVEDNATNAKILVSYLQSFGAHSRTAENGISALEMLDQAAQLDQYFDVALLDMKMSGMNGIELSKHIRNNQRYDAMRIIILTSNSYEGELASIRGSGCDLYLYKPLRKRALQDALLAVIAKHHSSVTAESHLFGLRVLLAEDNPVNQKITQAMLKELGCYFETAVNGLEALKIYKQGGIDMILMDCMMPDMDGYSATQEIRLLENEAGETRIPILALTANAMYGDRDKCLAAGMSDYLAKPFLLDDLREKMLAMLKSATSTRPVETVEPSSAPDPARFNPAPLNTLRQMGGEKLLAEVLALFRSNAPEQIEKLRHAVLERNLDASRHAAHSLKSAAANIGCVHLADQARAVENAARDGSLTFEHDIVDNLKTELDYVLQILPKQEQT